MLKRFTRLVNKIIKMEQQKLPLIVILGATGCGKTKLSLELAQKFGGEIVGADSMQIYKGLDILTAKATEEERALVPHYLVDELQPHEECNAYTYRNNALGKIDEIFAKNKLPIVVGGTNYYIESLIFKILVEGTNSPIESKQLVSSLEEKPSEELHQMLQEVDPERAQSLHPQDKRKIVRSLEVFKLMGCKHSKILKEQQTSEGGSSWGGGLRFPNSIIFWLECDQSVLDTRLDTRVDAMIEEGLVAELLDFHHRYNEQRLKNDETADYTKGIFQSIGLKDFHNYLLKTEAEREGDAGKILFDQAVEQLKTATRRYARKQKRWIINRFLSMGNREVPPVYSLDTTNVEKWHEKVGLPGQEIVQSYLDKSVCLHEALPKRKTNARSLSDSESHFCEVCQRVFIGNQWLIHMKSNRHKKAKRAKLELTDKVKL